jgi:Beta-lactamase
VPGSAPLQYRTPSEGQKYGYGISQFSWGPNRIYFHGGEMPGFNSKISYDPTNKLTLIIWTNLTASLGGQQTANTLFVKMSITSTKCHHFDKRRGLNARSEFIERKPLLMRPYNSLQGVRRDS